MTRQVVGRLLGDRTTLASVVGPATGSAAPGSKMSCGSPRNVIVAIRGRVPFAAHCERLPIGLAYRPVATPQLRSGVSLRVFIVREGEGS